MDSDDISFVTKIEKQVALISSNSDIDVVGAGMCFLDKDDNPIGHWHAPENHDQICKRPYRSLNIAHGTVLGKKSWFLKNPYNEKIPYAVDFDLFLRSYSNSLFANVKEPLYFYRFDDSFNLKKQLIDRCVSSKFLFNHYYKLGRFDKAVLNYCMQYGKLAATLIIFTLGLRKFMMSRRFETINDMQRNIYIQEIKKIKNIEIPI